MSLAKQTFVPAFGKPNPSAPDGLHFKKSGDNLLWKEFYKDIGAGWFGDRFLYLFGEGLARLDACLRAWSFLVPPMEDRMILGRNAYGAILVLENANSVGMDRCVRILDPFRVAYSPDVGIDLPNLILAYLPEKRLPEFLDSALYRAWMKVREEPLGDDVILAPKTPLGLGGTLTPDNVQEEDIVEFYRSSGPIYAKAFAKMKRPRP